MFRRSGSKRFNRHAGAAGCGGIAVFIGCTLMSAAVHAGGLPVCVSSNAQLANALASAQFVPTTIELVQGNYDLKNTLWHQGAFTARVQAGSELLGGYTAACGGRDIDVGNTVLDDSGSSPLDGADVLGDFTVEGITWAVPYGLTLAADTGYDVADDTEILLRRDAFVDVDNHGYQSVRILWYQDDDIGGTIRVVDTLIAGNTRTNCSLDIEVDAGTPKVQLVHDTIVDNLGSTQAPGSGACVFNHVVDIADGHGTLTAYNNIFHGNDGKDLHTDNQVLAPLFVANMIGPHSTPGATELGTLSGDPKLDADYRPIESPPSPAINSGNDTAPGGLPATDLPGRNRVVGTLPDRGAFESSIDDSFLQTVTNTNDSGAGSLRSAITGAVGHGSGLITFDIGSGCGPHVITLNSPLPAISVPLIINGFTQTGASANDLDAGDDANLCVILESSGSGATKALLVPTNASDDASLLLKGLAFSGFSDVALDLGAGSGHAISGNRFGGTASGHALQANGNDIRIDAAAHGAIIGGDDAADRNIISGATGSGLVMSDTHDNQIIKNMIGVGWNVGSNDFTDLGNGARGINLTGHDNTISGNFIGSNAQAGILLSGAAAHDNLIEANYIGFPGGAGGPYGNGQAGIHLGGDPGDAPSSNVIRYNVLAENGTQGAWVEIGQNNRIRWNGIYDNGGLGIDLAAAGILPNDNDGAAQGQDFANRGLNYPVLSGAVGNTGSGLFTGSMSSTLGTYKIDIYETPGGCDAGGNRQGAGRVGTTVVTISKAQAGGDGTASFSVTLGPGDFGSIANGIGITATATDSADNTSEFSACVPYVINDRIFADGFDGAHP